MGEYSIRNPREVSGQPIDLDAEWRIRGPSKENSEMKTGSWVKYGGPGNRSSSLGREDH